MTDGDLGKYKSELEAFRQRKRDFLDSCRMRMTLSDEYVALRRLQFDLDLYNSLCTAAEKEIRGGAALRDTLDGIGLSDSLMGTSSYATALVNGYIRHARARTGKGISMRCMPASARPLASCATT